MYYFWAFGKGELFLAPFRLIYNNLEFLLYGAILFGLIVCAYYIYKKGFKRGKEYTAIKDSTDPKIWTSKKWKYKITFPWHWNPIKRDDASILSPGADVFCENSSGFSTAVFAYKKTMSIKEAYNEILDNYRKISNIEILEEIEYTKDSIQYKKIIFKSDRHTHHVTIIVNDGVLLTISSNAPKDHFDTAITDFDNIADSIEFF